MTDDETPVVDQEISEVQYPVMSTVAVPVSSADHSWVGGTAWTLTVQSSQIPGV